MMLRRGDIAYVAIKGPYTGKPRPVVVIQADEATPFRDSVTVCPLTGDLIDAPVFRIRIAPTSVNPPLWGDQKDPGPRHHTGSEVLAGL